MAAICFYFQVHQPKRLRKYTYFDIGHNHYYEDDTANREIFLKVANKCYLPATSLFLELINKYNGMFKIAFSITGVFIEQCKRYSPETLDAFKRLAATGQVEFLNETYYHSLSFLFSQEEFKQQVEKHRQLIKSEFNYDATTFRNTELIYNDELAKVVDSLGYKVILAEGADKILGWRSPNYVYQPQDCQNLKLLLRNYRLTDDIAFRFSERSWSEYPVYADKYAYWLHTLHGQADLINLFMDFDGLVNLGKKEVDYDFHAKIDYANLAKLNLIKTDSLSVFKGDISITGRVLYGCRQMNPAQDRWNRFLINEPLLCHGAFILAPRCAVASRRGGTRIPAC